MIYGSVCSGIEAATVAWKPLGWKAGWFSEIEPFPSAVLAHHYPDVPNLGDMTRIHDHERFKGTTIDVLVGGTPCQSFSVAGLRKGMEDPRGNLALVYLSIADRARPPWVVWENVPGVLSSNEGRDFGAFLGALAELGYGWAYRVLDAQYFGVPQRRRRVFVVGYLGDWRRAASVLFERESLSRYSPPSRKEGERIAPAVTGGPPFSRTGNERVEAAAMVARMAAFGEHVEDGTASAMKARDYKDATDLVAVPNHETPILIDRAAFNQGKNAQYEPTIEESETSPSLVARGPHAVAVRTAQTGANGHGVSEDVAHTLDGAKGQTVAFQSKASSNNSMNPSEVAPTLDKSKGDGVAVTIPIDLRNATRDPEKKDEMNRQGVGVGEDGEPANTLSSACTHGVAHTFKVRCGKEGGGKGYLGQDEQAFTLSTGHDQHLAHNMTVRHLTPRECERLQGFKDDYTRILWKGRKASACPDGPRYKALGNSMAVPVMEWIGQRIEEVQRDIKKDK